MDAGQEEVDPGMRTICGEGVEHVPHSREAAPVVRISLVDGQILLLRRNRDDYWYWRNRNSCNWYHICKGISKVLVLSMST